MIYDKTQRVFLIEKYAKFESYSKVKAAYCKEFKLKKGPCASTIQYIVENFRKTGSVERKIRKNKKFGSN